VTGLETGHQPALPVTCP